MGTSHVVNVTSLFREVGINQEVEVKVNKHTYPYKACIEDNWVFYTGCALRRLIEKSTAEGRLITAVGDIGTGAGLEMMIACEIFRDTIQKIKISDLHPSIVNLAAENLRTFLHGRTVEIELSVGSLFKYWTTGLWDLILTNLPLIPAEGDLLEGTKTSSCFNPKQAGSSPEIFQKHLLDMQYAFLQQAYGQLRDGGSVLVALGGRVDEALIRELFEVCGYEYETLVVGIKRQTEPEEVLPNLAALERQNGVSFDFYDLTKVPSQLHGVVDMTVSELKTKLAPARVSATEALKLHEKGQIVSHVVQIIQGQKR